MGITLEDRIRVYLADYPYRTATELADTIKVFEKPTSPLYGISKVNLRKMITTIRNPKPKPDTSFYAVNIGCWHLPFHNREQSEAMIHLANWLSSIHKTKLNLVGDILDMNSISRHGKGKSSKVPGLTLSIEYQQANHELDKLDYGNYIEKNYLYGNHEKWYYDYMAEVDAAKLGEDVVKSPAEGLHLVERGYNVYTNYGQDYILMGNLVVTHGNYVNKHAAFAHLEAYKQNVLFFHTHRMQSFTDSGPNNTNITAYNGGFGGDRKRVVFNYMPEDAKRRWQNGFAITYTDNDGETYVTLLQWKNGKFVFMGREFTATGIKVIGE